MTLQRLLLATERTEHDAGAERVALALAAALGRGLQAVLPLASNPEYLGAAPELALQQEARALLALEALHAQAQAAGVPLRARVRPGDPLWQQIAAEAQAQQAELLVMRRVGKRGLLSRLLVGEMVSQAAAHARCPSLLVPAAATGLCSGSVLAVPFAGSDAAALFAAAGALALATGTPLRVCVPAGPDAAAGTQQAEAALRSAGVAGTVQVCHGEQIAAAGSEAGSADLLALGLAPAHTAHGRLAAEIEALAGRAAGPVLLVGAPRG